MRPFTSRLQDPALAFSLWNKLSVADIESSKDRAKVDAMINGEDPFEQSLLDETGQGDSANFNTLEAKSLEQQERSAYEDLIMSQKVLVELDVETGDNLFRKQAAQTVARIFTKTLRKWDEFEFWYNNLVCQFVRHGIGIVFYTDELDFRFRSCGLADFKLPRNTRATESAISFATALIPHDVSELYEKISAIEDSSDCCWNVEEVKRLVSEAAKPVVAQQIKQNWNNWEYVEQQMKENSIYYGYATSAVVWIVHCWIKEEDGTISHAMIARDGDTTKWLYFNKSRFKSINHAMILFTYDIGGGTYHSIRGRGWLMQPQVLANNMLTCRMADGAMSASSTMLQAQNQTQSDMDRMAVMHIGNWEILPPGLNFINRQNPDYKNSTLPVLQYLTEQSRRNNTGARPQLPAIDKNAPSLAIQIEQQNNASLSATSMSRFYNQLDKLFAETFRRVANPEYLATDPGGELVIEFRKELEKAGCLKALPYVTNVRATRAIGAGSAANRLMAYQRLERLAGHFDPEGMDALVRDIVSEEVGYENVDKYMNPLLPDKQRASVDLKVAEFENFMFQSGKQSPILPNQDHFVHLQVHIPVIEGLMQQVTQMGEEANLEMLIQTHTMLMAILPHSAQHVEAMSKDKLRHFESKTAMKSLQQAGAMADRLRNQIVRLQKAQQDADIAEQQRQQEEMQAYIAQLEQKAAAGGPDSQDAQRKIVDAQVKLQIADMEFQQRQRHREIEFNQKQALKDAEMAHKLITEAKPAPIAEKENP